MYNSTSRPMTASNVALERQRPHVALEEGDLREAKPAGPVAGGLERPPVHVDADHLAARTDDVGGEEGHVPGAAADVEHAHPG